MGKHFEYINLESIHQIEDKVVFLKEMKREKEGVYYREDSYIIYYLLTYVSTLVNLCLLASPHSLFVLK